MAVGKAVREPAAVARVIGVIGTGPALRDVIGCDGGQIINPNLAD